MKILNTILVLILFAGIAMAQDQNDLIITYGFNAYLTNNRNIIFNVQAEENGRSLAIGSVISIDPGEVIGYEIRHKSFINYGQRKDSVLISYIHYNFLHYKTEIKYVIIIEHHIGIGWQFRLKNNFYFDSSIGIGIEMYRGGYNFTSLFKLGIGYKFKKNKQNEKSKY